MQRKVRRGKLHSCYTDVRTRLNVHDCSFSTAWQGVRFNPRWYSIHSLPSNIKTPFSSRTDAGITGQIGYVIVKATGTEGALSSPPSGSKLGGTTCHQHTPWFPWVILSWAWNNRVILMWLYHRLYLHNYLPVTVKRWLPLVLKHADQHEKTSSACYLLKWLCCFISQHY